MKKITILSATTIIFLLVATTAFSARIFAGYAGMKWGTDYHSIIKSYKKGNTGKIAEQVVYKQVNPNKEIRQRTFAFRDNRLTAVSVSFNADYVKKTGIENLLAKHKKAYGEGAMDRSGAPHMITCLWEDAVTKITFAYSPKRPEMTVLMYQRK